MTAPVDSADDTNLPPPLENYSLFATDQALVEAVEREGAGVGIPELERFGSAAGTEQAFAQGRRAAKLQPELVTHDRQGRRISRVEYPASYHACLAMSCAEGLHASVWENHPAMRPGAHVARAAGLFMAVQMESGHCAALSATCAAVAGLLRAPDLLKTWLPKVVSRDYDPTQGPISGKPSALIGVALAERQGGTDLRSSTTQALPKGPVGAYSLIGEKWFVSAPMSDAFITLAHANGGLSCFLVPRYLPDGTVNNIALVRLKDQLGSRSSAVADLDLNGAHAWLIGSEGEGLAIAAEVLRYMRLDHAVMAAGLMRLGFVNALHHAKYRTVYGRTLADEPLMAQVLADIALDVEAAVALIFRLARAFDRASDPRAAAWCRLMTPVTKYWVCKIAQWANAEAMEALGGEGYGEAAPLPRIARDLPLHAIAAGPGNVMALEVLSVLQREPESVSSVMEDLAQASAGDAGLEAAHARVEAILQEPRWLDQRARALTESLAHLAAGTILRAHAPALLADAFIATRTAQALGRTYGQGIDAATAATIIGRAWKG